MKLAYVVHQFLPNYFSGTEQYVFALAQEMLRRGHSVEVFTLEPEFARETPAFEERSDEVDGLPVHRIAYWRDTHPNPVRAEYQNPLVGHRFGRWLDERKPDVVHFFHLRYLGANLLSEARRRGVGIAVHLMDFWYLCPVFLLLRADGSLCDGPPEGGMGCFPCINADLGHELERSGLRGEVDQLRRTSTSRGRAGDGLTSLYNAVTEREGYLREQLLQADRIIAPSIFLKDMFVKNGVPSERIDVRTYGLDRARLETLAEARERGAAARTPEDAALRVGYLGTLSHYKGVHVVVEALRRCEGVDLQLDIHGRLEDYPEYSAELQRQAEGDERIRFRGAFGRERLGEVLAELDLLVVPSLWYENTPFAVLEAFAAGVPVFASNLGGMSELVRQEQNGELFERSNAEDLADRLRRIAGERERLVRYREAMEPVKRIDQNADEIVNLYEAAAATAAVEGAAS